MPERLVLTDATKATLLLGALALAALAGGAYGIHQSRGRAAALHQAAVAKGEARAERQAKEAAQADRAAADQVSAAQTQRVAQLQAELDRRPRPAPAQPVPADAPVAVVVAGLQQLGLRPQPLGPDGPLALGLTLADGHTTLGWGREALRVPGLEARLATLDDLTQAQHHQAVAKDQQLAATDRALGASEAESAALRRQTAALQRAVNLTPRWRPTGVGLIGGLDEGGRRHVGAIVSHSWGPVEVGALYLNRNVGVSAVYRF